MRGLRALERTYVAVFRRHPVLVPLAVIMTCAETAYAGVNNFALPLYIASDGASLGVSANAVGRIVGLITATFLLSETIGRLPLGRLSDILGRRPLMIAGPSLGAASFLVLSQVGDFRAIFPLRMLDGLGAAALWPALFATIGDRVPRAHRATAMSVVNTVYMVGIALGPSLAGAVIKAFHSHRAPFVMASGFLLVAAGTAAFAVAPRRALHGTAPGETGHTAVSRRRLVAMLAVMFGQTFGVILLAPFLTLYAKQELKIASGDISLLFVLPAAAVAVLAMPLGRLADRLERQVAVKIGLCAGAVAMWLIPLARSLWALAGMAVVLAVAYALAAPSWLAMVTEVAPEQQRGTLLGRFGVAQGMGAVLGPLVGGFLYDRAHWYPFVASAAILTISTLVAFAGLPRSREP
jgi:DHA1 family multidrug resistance protein-like MFS transporter